MLLIFFWACGGKSQLIDTSSAHDTADTGVVDSGDSGDTEIAEYIEPTYSEMDPVMALNRISLALRGIRPSVADLTQVQNDPSALQTLAEQYVESPQFVETMGDMYAEILQMRSLVLALPEIGDMTGYTRQEIRNAMAEEPLEIIKEVVRNDLPFGTIVTADWTMLNEINAKMWANHTYNVGQGGLQKVFFTDERPAGGVLTSNSYLIRHESNGSNYHRGRASIISDKFLCAPFSGRDIPITGEVDLTDDEAVAEALMNQSECISCHQTVDPLAAHFWGTRNRLTPFQILVAEQNGCDSTLPTQFSCYPVPMFSTGYETRWAALGLRAPHYWGSATTDLGDMGQQIAEDPRFSLCAAQKFTSYLTQVDEEDLDYRLIVKHQQRFIDSNQNAKDLALAIVTDPSFLALQSDPPDHAAGIQVLRPEQLRRMLYKLVDYELIYDLTDINNAGNIPFFLDDNFGFRAMSGGVDGENVIFPTHTPTPIKLLTFATYAEEFSGYIVSHDESVSPSNRVLFSNIDMETTDETLIREEIARFHGSLYGLLIDADHVDIDPLYTLWTNTEQVQGTDKAWMVLLAAMLQSPDVIFY